MTPHGKNAIPASNKAKIVKFVENNELEESLSTLAHTEGYKPIATLLTNRHSLIKEEARKQLRTAEETRVAFNRLGEDILKILSSDSDELDLEEVSSPNAPLLPINYVLRTEFFVIQNAIIQEEERYFGITGLPGSGKSVLAASLAHSKKVQVAYDGGIYWVGSADSTEVEVRGSSLILYQQQLYAQLQNEPITESHFNTWQEGLVYLQREARHRLANRKSLIIVDCHPIPDDLLKAIEIHENAVFLITTSDREFLHANGVKKTATFTIGGLNKDEAIGLLSRWTEIPEKDLPEAAREFALKVDYLPLAIAMVGAILKGATEPDSAWADVLEAVREGDLEDISHAVDKYPFRTLTSVFQLAVNHLKETDRNRFYELATFPAGWRFQLGDFIALWKEQGEPERKVRRLVQGLINKALLQQSASTSYVLHNLIRVHIRNQVSDWLPMYQRIGTLLFPDTPLPILATVWQDEEALKAMIGRININEAIPNGSTSLLFAAQSGYQGIVNMLLDAGALIDQKGNTGFTALMVASQNGHAEVVTSLLHSGAEINAQDSEGFAALHYAAQSGHDAIVHSLLRNGAIPNLANNYKKSALYIASFHGRVPVVEELLRSLPLDAHETDPQLTPLVWATQKGHVKVVRVLLDAGANVDWSSPKDGSTALHIAAQKGFTEIVELLIQAGVSVNTRMNEGYTPLHLAAQEAHVEIVALLIDAGADVHAINDHRHTPLHSASQERHEDRHREVVAKLIEAGADVNAQNDMLLTPLIYAAILLDTEMGRLLIEAGADVNLTQADSYTALHIALIQGDKLVLSAARQQLSFSITEEGSNLSAATVLSFEDSLHFIQLLLNNGASVNVAGANGNGPLHLAAAIGDAASVELLLGAGASPDATNAGGETPLELAVKGSGNIYNQLLAKRDYAAVIELLRARLASS